MLGEFEDKWDDAYLPISQSWRRNWVRITPFFDYPPEIRKVKAFAISGSSSIAVHTLSNCWQSIVRSLSVKIEMLALNSLC